IASIIFSVSAAPLPPTCSPFALLLSFLSSSGDHRDLHFFPTRRSSDLQGSPGRDPALHGRHRWPPHGGGARVHLGPHGRASRPQDRKSTRLNSSHGSISYAVFCLKKKKHIQANDTPT